MIASSKIPGLIRTLLVDANRRSEAPNANWTEWRIVMLSERVQSPILMSAFDGRVLMSSPLLKSPETRKQWKGLEKANTANVILAIALDLEAALKNSAKELELVFGFSINVESSALLIL